MSIVPLELIRSLQRNIHRERMELEVELDAITGDPALSPRLSAMLQKEATVGREQRVEARRRMAAEVDGLMRRELQAFVQREQREKQARRRALHATHERELEALSAALRRAGHDGAAHVLARRRSPPALEAGVLEARLRDPTLPFPEREAAMRRLDEARLAEHEAYNIREAFDTQRLRVEAEWSDFIAEHRSECEAEAARVCGEPVDFDGDSRIAAGRGAGMPLGVGLGNGVRGRWQRKEKQAQLVHTAPVLAPAVKGPPSRRGRGGRGARGRSRRAPPSSRAAQQVAQLQRYYAETLKQVELQREDALRWIQRQETRMLDEARVAGKAQAQAGAAEADIDDRLRRAEARVASAAE